MAERLTGLLLAGLIGRAIPAEPAYEPKPAPDPATAIRPDLDDELIVLCREHVANRERFNAGELDSDESPHWPAYQRTLEAITASRPRTIFGMSAKAAAARVEARLPSGGEDPEHTLAARWAWDLVCDMAPRGDVLIGAAPGATAA